MGDSETAILQPGTAAQPKTPRRILIADDNVDVLAVMNHVIRYLGHIVVGTAVNGRECIRRAAALRPDLVLVDFRMPDSDGIETADAISKTSAAPVVIVTGATDEETIARIDGANIAGRLPKPFTLDQMALAIERSCSPATA